MSVDTYKAKSRVSSLHMPLNQDPNNTCTHPRVIGEECQDCNQHVGDDYGIGFDYIRKGLRLSHEEVDRLRDVESKRLFTQKKLHLVLDIDHTLVHSVARKDLNPEETASLEVNTESLQGCLVMRESIGYLVKLRPFVRTFLKEASTMFEMYLYTRGQRVYAMNIAQLLDQEGMYFGNRIISREDSPPGIRTLDGQKHAVLILDDTESVWPRDRENLIQIEKYYYFAKGSNRPQRYSQMGTDESETNGGLAKILRVLKVIHKIYLDDDQGNVDCRNVRLLVESLRCSILEGYKLYFDYVDSENVSPRICLMAKELEAKLSMERNCSVTHLVSLEERIEDLYWAVQEKKFLVSPQWIKAAYYSWERPPEEEFPIEDLILLSL